MKTILAGDRIGGVLFDIQKERERQKQLLADGKFPFDCDDADALDVEKLAVLAEEFGEVSREVNEIMQYRIRRAEGSCPTNADTDYIIKERKRKLRAELIQVATVCVSWCEGLDAQEERNRDNDTYEELLDPLFTPQVPPTRHVEVVKAFLRSMRRPDATVNSKQAAFNALSDYIEGNTGITPTDDWKSLTDREQLDTDPRRYRQERELKEQSHSSLFPSPAGVIPAAGNAGAEAIRQAEQRQHVWRYPTTSGVPGNCITCGCPYEERGLRYCPVRSK